ncbi:MAG TPA: translation initiation factor [Chitinophagaceae bacterium]|nr:translation initiation factor [Chitinophagaceae bacterium]
MSRHKKYEGGMVYSTHPGLVQESQEEERETLPPEAQQLYVRTDSKHRAGKIVTLVEGFVGRSADLDTLGKQLKIKCGSGGSVKDGQIILQGDYKQKVVLWLQQMKYRVKG